MHKKRILIACEESATVRQAFEACGAFDVWSCDMKPSRVPGQHYTGDVRHVLAQHWDMIIAHPPCTFITNTGVCWLKDNPQRWCDLRAGCEFFKLFLDHPCKRICIENPIPHKYAVALIGCKYTQLVQPYHFGHMESKATCFWLKGLPQLIHTKNVKREMLRLPKRDWQRLHYLPPGPKRAEERSKTFSGIANAMAAQWGAFLQGKPNPETRQARLF